MLNLRVPHSLLVTLGTVGVLLILVAETGLLIKFIHVLRTVLNPLAGTVDVPVRELALRQMIVGVPSLIPSALQVPPPWRRPAREQGHSER